MWRADKFLMKEQNLHNSFFLSETLILNNQDPNNTEIKTL